MADAALETLHFFTDNGCAHRFQQLFCLLIPVIKGARMVDVATMGRAEFMFAFTLRRKKRHPPAALRECTPALHSV